MLGVPVINQMNLSILSSIVDDVHKRILELQLSRSAPLRLEILCAEIAIRLVDSLSTQLPHGSYEQRKIHLDCALRALVPHVLNPSEAEPIKLLALRRLSLEQAPVSCDEHIRR